MRIRTKALNKGKKTYPVTARLWYSSGRIHGAIDIATPIGTRLYAPRAGVIVATSDGVRNNYPGQRRWSGMPSNWILLKTRIKTNYGHYQPVTILFQHLSPGLKVRPGQRVKKGQYMGRTGNSGNSSGPHIHIGGQWVTRSHPANRYHRYDHVNNARLRVWPPERLLK